MADEGRDQPEPVAVEDVDAPVNLAVTSLGCEDDGCVAGLEAISLWMSDETNRCGINPQAGVPGLETMVFDTGGKDDEDTAFFSKNFLLMLTALNRLGCGWGVGVEDVEGGAVLGPSGTSKGL